MGGKYDPFGTCRQCGDRILWVKTKAGKNMPVNPELVNYKAVPGGERKNRYPGGSGSSGRKVQCR